MPLLRRQFLTLIYELNSVCFSSLTPGAHKNQLQAENSIPSENLSTYFSFVAEYNKFKIFQCFFIILFLYSTSDLKSQIIAL